MKHTAYRVSVFGVILVGIRENADQNNYMDKLTAKITPDANNSIFYRV